MRDGWRGFKNILKVGAMGLAMGISSPGLAIAGLIEGDISQPFSDFFDDLESIAFPANSDQYLEFDPNFSTKIYVFRVPFEFIRDKKSFYGVSASPLGLNHYGILAERSDGQKKILHFTDYGIQWEIPDKVFLSSFDIVNQGNPFVIKYNIETFVSRIKSYGEWSEEWHLIKHNCQGFVHFCLQRLHTPGAIMKIAEKGMSWASDNSSQYF